MRYNNDFTRIYAPAAGQTPAPNWPSKTGGPSGGGRTNNPPGGKGK